MGIVKATLFVLTLMPFAGRNGHRQTFIYFGRFKDVTSCSTFSFLCNVLYNVVCHFILFLLAIVFSVFFLLSIVLSVLRFTASDNPFDIFKLLVIVLSVLRFTASDNPFGIFKLLVIVLSVLRLTTSDNPFGIFKLFGHCVVCSSTYGF